MISWNKLMKMYQNARFRVIEWWRCLCCSSLFFQLTNIIDDVFIHGCREFDGLSESLFTLSKRTTFSDNEWKIPSLVIFVRGDITEAKNILSVLNLETSIVYVVKANENSQNIADSCETIWKVFTSAQCVKVYWSFF